METLPKASKRWLERFCNEYTATTEYSEYIADHDVAGWKDEENRGDKNKHLAARCRNIVPAARYPALLF